MTFFLNSGLGCKFKANCQYIGPEESTLREGLARIYASFEEKLGKLLTARLTNTTGD